MIERPLPPLPQAVDFSDVPSIAHVWGYTAEQMHAYVLADRAASAPQATEAERVCYQAYQVVGSLLSDLGKFNTPEAERILDNLSQAKMVHDNVLPWDSYEVSDASAPQAVRPTCPACGTHEVSLEQTCHNSTCKEYAHATTIYEGWKEPTKESALAASIAEKERKRLANSALAPQDSTKEGEK